MKCKRCGGTGTEPRDIIADIGAKHGGHVKAFGSRFIPTIVYLGEEELALASDVMCMTAEPFLARVRDGEAQIQTAYGLLTICAVDSPAHLALGGFK